VCKASRHWRVGCVSRPSSACTFSNVGLSLQDNMTSRTICWLAIVGALLVLTNPPPTFACVCRGAEQPPCVAFREATAVFSGVVADIADAPFQQGSLFHLVLISFKVEQVYKGVSDAQVAVATVTQTDCDFNFQKDERYFVYAYNDSKHNRLVTGVCTRTRRLISAEEDLIHARLSKVHDLRASILGADKHSGSPLEGSEIRVEGQGRKYTAIADERGIFKIALEHPGTYKVTIIGPTGSRFLNHLDTWRVFSVDGRPAVEFERKVAAGQCDFVDFSELLTVRTR
jgi:hypothetical protein